ncbi:predicted protein [Phaeodactylum tricornutum CCAP 1055/1]|uniref:HTH myb-type domain-containing protein n=1 Tax=Phaeodactylum tricornutum (strain CCAP 1055/1) TaxID=556484 RepID=B7FTR1_PHATC|nr:predicted protein [Phaeodactylum tricornutum CCAP 1055/1]EEC50126.1 predicted protein [Phaeodactylum tricornutum CCAP 1055/1]|eukprot:XP_002178461.1 predicted protein [Phaeodactylum tricornutum CCAP 1055/1]
MTNLSHTDPTTVVHTSSHSFIESTKYRPRERLLREHPSASANDMARSAGSVRTDPHPTEHAPLAVVGSPHRTGRWTLDEKILFLYGLRKFGKGKWKKMSAYLPNRSLVQIKSHAQKVLKRIDQGEHVFRRIEENNARLELLVASIHDRLGHEAPALLLPKTAAANKRPRRSVVSPKVDPPIPAVELDAQQHIIAASALCQLAAPTGPGAWDTPTTCPPGSTGSSPVLHPDHTTPSQTWIPPSDSQTDLSVQGV